MKDICCAHCGAKMVEYTFTFNKGLARCLWLMRHHTNGVEIKTLKMSSSMWTNFQKLRYWNLIEPVMGENSRKGGYWKITTEGLRFLKGETVILQKVKMYRNEVKLRFGKALWYNEVSDGYLYREDYKDQVREA